MAGMLFDLMMSDRSVAFQLNGYSGSNITISADGWNLISLRSDGKIKRIGNVNGGTIGLNTDNQRGVVGLSGVFEDLDED